jgi:phosphomannomutase
LVLDAGNGAWSTLAPSLFEALGFVVHRLFCQVDGRFPNRAPDSARAANLSRLQMEVRNSKADVGIAWDGDGDRVSFVDNDGNFVSADEISMFIARKLLSGRPGERVTYDIKLSDAFRRVVLSLQGIPLIERSGHTFLKRRVIESHCLLGCEISGHYFFRELHGGDDGLFAALHIVELLQNGKCFAQLRQELPRFYITPDLRLPAEDAAYETVVMRLRKTLQPASEIEVDGVRIETDEGFTLVRRSVTEPVITIRMEGFSQESLQALMNKVKSSLIEFSQAIQTQISQESKT